MCVACALSKTVFVNFCREFYAASAFRAWPRLRRFLDRIRSARLGAAAADRSARRRRSKRVMELTPSPARSEQETEGAIHGGAGVASVDRQGGLAVRSGLC